MKKSILCLFCLLAAMAVSASELLHYDFQTLTPDGLLQDLSGSGHHGAMSGEFAKVECDGHQGLFFNGQDSAIIPRQQEALKISGDLSLVVTFRITKEQGDAVRRKSPMIIGSDELAGVNRNYTLFFDYGTHICLNVSNGISGSTHFIENVADGKLHTAELVLAYPQVLLYLDGKCLEHAPLAVFPDKKVGGSHVNVGFWKYGHFLGELYDLRVFDHALTEAEALSLAGVDVTELPCRFAMEIGNSDVLRTIDWELNIDNIPDEARAIRVQIQGAKDEHTVALTKQELERKRYWGTGSFSTKSLPWGQHTLTAALLDDKGNVLLSATQDFVTAELDVPEKYSNSIGISEKVLPPWTPMEVKQSSGTVEVSVWNRRYVFHDELLSSTIFTGKTLSDTPSSLELAVDGQPSQLSAAPVKLLKDAKHQVILEQSASNEDMDITATHTIDYDGFDRIIVRLQAKRALNLTDLRFLYPLKAAQVKTAFASLNEARPLTRQKNYHFQPVLFVGDEERGLSFLAESDEFWYPKGNTKAIAITPRDGQDTMLSFHPVATSLAMKQGEVFTYDFALTATPVRPMTKNCWDQRIVCYYPYCEELESIYAQKDGKTMFQLFKETGMRRLGIVRTEHAFSYPPIPGSEYSRKLKDLVDVAHTNNVLIAPYAVGFLFSERAPEWKEHRLYCVTPTLDFSRRGDFLEKESGYKQHTYTTCTGKYLQDLMLYRVRDAVENTGIDGVYLDGTVDSFPCNNAIHGCGYIDRQGIKHCTFNSFRARELIRRLYTLLYEKRGDKVFLELHYSIAFNAPAAAWATSLLSGEQLQPAKHAYESLPPECMRFSYVGQNIGTGVDLLTYTTRVPFHQQCALSLVHNVSVRPAGLGTTRECSQIWAKRDEFGLDKAEFIGYWKEECPVKAKETGVYVSCFRRAGKPLVLIVSNLTEQKQTVNLVNAAGEQLKLPSPFELGSEDFVFVELEE